VEAGEGGWGAAVEAFALALQVVIVLLAHAESIDEELVDVPLRPVVEIGAVVETGEGVGNLLFDVLDFGGAVLRFGGLVVGGSVLCIRCANLLVSLPGRFLAFARAIERSLAFRARFEFRRLGCCLLAVLTARAFVVHLEGGLLCDFASWYLDAKVVTMKSL